MAEPVRHNWYKVYETGMAYTCVTEERSFGLLKGATCSGCGATIPANSPLLTTFDQMDELWHEKYRPMAALCCMVEEATQPDL